MDFIKTNGVLLFSIFILYWSVHIPTEEIMDTQKMIQDQIMVRGIVNEKVLEAMSLADRKEFVSRELQKSAYNDSPLPIGYNQTISQPYIVAFMTEAAQLDKASRVLEIGTGSGYQAAILAELCKEVYTIEVVKSLGQSAKKKLEELGYKNIHVRIGDGYKGWSEEAPFDAIIVTAAPEEIPAILVKQLNERGRLIIPVGKFNQELMRITREKDGIKTEKLMPVRFVPMVKKRNNDSI
jgi:protein-L-isoaspartate(D-aspartate) O-methyltransferase